MQERMTWWAPTFKGGDEPRRSMAIPWRGNQPPTEREYKSALVEHMDQLIKADRKEARWALDIEEDFEQIRRCELIDYWAIHIGLSPHMNLMLARVDWEAQSPAFEFEDVDDIPSLCNYIEGLGIE